MATNFQFYRNLCCSPAELEPERRTFEAAVAEFVEQVSMPDAVLFAPASLRPPIVASARRLEIEDNIRMCEFFIQIVGEQNLEPVFQAFVEYALQCAADPSMATRKVCLLFRNYQAAAPELRRFREGLAAGQQCSLRDFSSEESLAGQLHELLLEWYAPLKPAPA